MKIKFLDHYFYLLNAAIKKIKMQKLEQTNLTTWPTATMEYHLTAKEMVMVFGREIFQPYILGKRS
jgi:hypothetical protein